jgi:dihydrofolate reductase
MYTFAIIVAICEKTRGIGYNGKIPWKCQEDMIFFRTITTEVPSEEYINVVIMGRNTFESLGSRPLKNRLNIVCSRTLIEEPSLKHIMADSLENALVKINDYKSSKKIHKVFVIGGQQLYEDALNHPQCSELFINCLRLPGPEIFDTFFPEIDTNKFCCVEEKQTERINYTRYVPISPQRSIIFA